LLRGDLDNIILKALRKEPARRYASVAQFSEDIRRYLEGRPVSAHKGTFGYRAGKFIRRNKFAAAAVALFILCLVGGILATSLEARRANLQRARAERRFNDVRHLANSLMFEIHDSVKDLHGATPTRRLIVSRALEYLDGLAQEAADDGSLQRELVSAYVKVGNVQGNPNNANLGDTNGALNSYRQARRIADQILAVNPADSEARRSLAVVYEKMGDVEAATGDLSAAVDSARKSLAIFNSISQANPQNARAQRSLAISYIKVGDVLGNSDFPNAGNDAEAMANYRASWAIWQALDKANPNSLDTLSWLARIHERMGTILEQQGKAENALESYRESQRIREGQAKDNPENSDVVRDAAVAAEKMGNALTTLGDLNGAFQNRTKSLEIFKQLAEADPRNAQAQLSLAISYMHLADLLGYPDSPNLGRRDEASENYQRARDVLQRAKDSGLTDAAVQANLDLVSERMKRF
jgi:non-specific serine/threonine protein kinase/serine/threonine-protein kinase